MDILIKINHVNLVIINVKLVLVQLKIAKVALIKSTELKIICVSAEMDFLTIMVKKYVSNVHILA